MNTIALSVFTHLPLFTCHALLIFCLLLSRLKTEADIGIRVVAFHKTFTIYFHCLLHPEEAEWRNVGVLNEILFRVGVVSIYQILQNV